MITSSCRYRAWKKDWTSSRPVQIPSSPLLRTVYLVNPSDGAKQGPIIERGQAWHTKSVCIVTWCLATCRVCHWKQYILRILGPDFGAKPTTTVRTTPNHVLFPSIRIDSSLLHGPSVCCCKARGALSLCTQHVLQHPRNFRRGSRALRVRSPASAS